MNDPMKVVFGTLGLWRILAIGYYAYGWTIGNSGSPGSYGIAYPFAIILGFLFWLLPVIALVDMIFTFVRWRKQSGIERTVKLGWSFVIFLNAYVLFFVVK